MAGYGLSDIGGFSGREQAEVDTKYIDGRVVFAGEPCVYTGEIVRLGQQGYRAIQKAV